MKQDHDNPVEEQRRDLELGAALAALPHPELPDDMDARLRAALEIERRRRRRHRRVATLALAAALAALALGGAALAGAFDSDSSAPWPEPPLPAESVYPTNAAGQTYGGEKPLVKAPDLVAVVATNGKHGYCLNSQLNGRPNPPKTPEEAKAMSDRGLRGYTIPVYESDGVTQIGVFQIGGPGTTSYGGTPDGGKVSKTADANLNIITTTTHPDGTVTVETEALDGTITTKTYEDESDVPAVKVPRITVSAAPGPESDKPPAWLLESMSRLARESGDSGATAWWELQTRYYLKPIEGENAPESPYQQWTSVWLVILHGDFAGGGWRYWLLDPHSHNVISQGLSDQPFDTSSHDLQPMPGPITLGEK
jgi:hypothetical protein